ncbi:MAG TPA: 3-carboxy-cis,cis-muconate cycloisomerase [Thermoleophilaceae bacterium]|nr:3-carboxy-cis,cis-muconate cycloisomerase [Thermoleophilaceae bacterium]
MFARGRVAAEVDDRAWLQAMLDFEAALARAGAPADAAQAIADACRADDFDIAEIGRSSADNGTPVPGLLKALRAKLPEEAAAHLHRGATSQDVVDTAAMLVAQRALGPLLEDLAGAANACAVLAQRFRDTPAPGRTLLQQALPITFGLKAAGWLSGLDEVRDELAHVRERGLALQLGGAVGTLAALGDDGLKMAAAMAASLDLEEPALPWHTIRTRPARLAGALGSAAGVMGKIARDVALLAQTEVAEASEGGDGRGGSSTMPHKRNPVGAVAVAACAERVPGLVATMLAAMAQEHERAAGAWQAEWETLSDLLRLTGSAAFTLRELLEGLEPDPERMRSNLDITGGLLMAESVVTALTPSLGRAAAQELVEGAAGSGGPIREVLLELPEVKDALGEQGLDSALAPEGYLGVAGELIDRALAAHRA